MTLSSMTGFGRATGHFEHYSWVWELRSVNGKGLDVRMRIPPGLDAFDQYIKNTVKKAMTRGNINVSLQLTKDSSDTDVKVNEAALDKLVSAAKHASVHHGLPMPSLDSLLSIRDVVEITTAEDSEEMIKGRDAALQQSFDEALAALKSARDEEGVATKKMLSDVVGEVEDLLNQAEKIAATQPEQLKKKYMEKVDALLDNSKGLDQERLAQEVVVLATKADTKEETDRLRAHIASARNLLNETGPVGRKFDFLTQEFNREANTLCSKSTDISLTNIGLSLKTAIDQIREQVQNVE
ncbi:YicC/YloC family endoribonuclease [Pseudemcibacter aquimaris]|uniref:YicC/YloC family endoribonuclease n=1 Tax=Pseudemcibacter aquimaris TaxID=2857064 RepID=UPI0020110C61|nr:YicC/YloC family endoribonuclease [Pseudemcibacter aquimaris]MCC3859965.1 YicC family protein [Pseudemcibacter aquimaris]WDU57297.1 YicC family protein [Pseudemcibacter aquimaris]